MAGGNVERFLIIQAIIAFIGAIMITDEFSHNNDNLKWIDYKLVIKVIFGSISITNTTSNYEQILRI